MLPQRPIWRSVFTSSIMPDESDPPRLGIIAEADKCPRITKLSLIGNYFQMETLGAPTELDMLKG